MVSLAVIVIIRRVFQVWRLLRPMKLLYARAPRFVREWSLETLWQLSVCTPLLKSKVTLYAVGESNMN
jgi:hypothetical protein